MPVVRIEAHPDVVVPDLPAFMGAQTPDYAEAIWFPTSCDGKCTYGRPDGYAAVDTIVVHDTEGGWYASVATLQFDPGKSVHYIVDADGSRVGQFLHEVDTAWHAGNWFYNKHSVGIEHVGRAADPRGYDTNLYWTSVSVVGDVMSRWPNMAVNRAQVIGHYQIPNGTRIPQSSPPCRLRLGACETSPNYGGASTHRDPGLYWQWCQYLERLGGTCTCNDAYAHWNCTTDLTEAVRCAGGIILPDAPVEIDHCEAGCVVRPIGEDDLCQHLP